MALQRDAEYPGRFEAPTPEQPQGAFKNRTSSTSNDGSFIEKKWLNDWSGFFSSLLASQGVSPDGEVDEVGASQYFDAFIAEIASQNNVSKFESSQQAIVAAGAITMAHGLGAEIFDINAFLVCLSDDGGYVSGDVINVSTSDMMAVSYSHDTGVTFKTDGTNIYARYGTGADIGSSHDGRVFFVIDGVTGERAALDNTKWNMIVRAWT